MVRTALNPSRTVLANGAVLLTKRTTTTPAVAINLAMKAGSASDPPGAEGTTWLLSRVIDRGVPGKSAAEIAEELDNRGITVSMTVTRHLLSLSCTCLAEDFETVFNLVAAMMIAPTLPEEEIAARKLEVVTAIRQDEDNPMVRASEALMAQLYPDGHPYGRPTKGTVEIVERLTRRDLEAQHAAWFAPERLSAAIVGDIDTRHVEATAARVLGGWRRGVRVDLVLPPVRRSTERRRLIIPMMSKSQADIAYGFTTITRRDPDYYACWLMNVIFGQYAIGGRLGDSIRERQGMAYYVSSSMDANVAEGPFAIRAGVAAGNVDRAVASIDEEINRLVADGVTVQELDESRRYLIGAMPRALETNAAIANFLHTAEFFALGADYDVQLPGRLHAVTLDAVNAAARRLLDPRRATIVIAGPYETSIG